MSFSSQTTIGWQATLGATHGNTYRGSIPQGLLGGRLRAAVYDHVCFESDAAGDGAKLATDGSIPLAGPLGTSSSGTVRPNPSP